MNLQGVLDFLPPVENENALFICGLNGGVKR